MAVHVIQSGNRRLGLNESTTAIVNLEVSTWINNLTSIYSNSASLDTNFVYSHDIFVSDLKNAGIWDKMIALNTFPYSSYNTAAAQHKTLMLTPLRPGIGSPGVWSWVSSGGTPNCNVTGYSPNGNFYIDCGLWFPYAFSNPNSHGASVYHYTGSTNGAFLLGAAPNYTYIFGIQNAISSGNYGINNIVLASGWSSPSAPGGYGFFSFSRTGSTASTAYNGNSLGGFTQQSSSNSATVASSNCGANLTVFQMQSALNALWYSPTSYISFVAFHQGLSKLETENLYNAVQRLRQGLGGGYK